MSGNLQKNILATLAYYDVMDYPMTGFEVWKYLTKANPDETSQDGYSLEEVMEALDGETLKKVMEEYRGFYFLRGRKYLVDSRIKKNKISEEKYKKIVGIVRWLEFVPFVRSVSVSGRVAMKNALNESDVDLKIFLKKGKIFTGRILVTAFVHILGRRRHGKKIKNRICLNHFIVEGADVRMKDMFSAHEYAFLRSVFGQEVLDEFLKNNSWIRGYKINLAVEHLGVFSGENNKLGLVIKKLLENILNSDFVESALKKWQIGRIEKNPKTKQAGAVIICDDSELAFWPNFENQGPKIFSDFKNRLENMK